MYVLNYNFRNLLLSFSEKGLNCLSCERANFKLLYLHSYIGFKFVFRKMVEN